MRVSRSGRVARVKVRGIEAKGIIGGTGYKTHPYISSDPCVYCYGPANSREHVVPRSRGGAGQDNVVAACQTCNRGRGSEPLLHYLLRRRKSV